MAKKPKALRHRITIKTDIDGTTNAYNEPEAATKTIVKDLPCLVEALRGRELENARQLKGTITHKITWRRYDGIKPQHYGTPDFDTTKTLYIESVIHDERKHDYEALATERVT